MKPATDNRSVASQIQDLIAAFDKATEDIHKADVERRRFLNRHHSYDPADQAKRQAMHSNMEKLEKNRAVLEFQLGELLAKARVAVCDLADKNPDAKEVIAFLDNEEESALVRCERAAEFLNSKTASA